MRNFIKLLFSLLILASMLDAKETVTLSFFDTVNVSDSIIKLENIARVSSSKPELSGRIAQFTIGESAPAGYQRLVNCTDLIDYALKGSFPGVEFKATATTSRVLVKTSFVSSQIRDYLDKIQSYIYQNVAWSKEECTVVLLDSASEWKSLRKPENVTITGLTNRNAKGQVALFLDAQNGPNHKHIPFRCLLQVKVPVLVASEMECAYGSGRFCASRNRATWPFAFLFVNPVIVTFSGLRSNFRLACRIKVLRCTLLYPGNILIDIRLDFVEIISDL